MDKLFCLQGKAIVITGGAGILCSAIAKYLACQGARICIVDYDKSRTSELVKEVESEGGSAIPVCANVLDKNEMRQAFGCAIEKMGKVDVPSMGPEEIKRRRQRLMTFLFLICRSKPFAGYSI